MAAEQGLMAGKRGLILGLANDRSIAWGIARQAAQLVDLQKQLTTALDQTQALAHKAIEGTSGKK